MCVPRKRFFGRHRRDRFVYSLLLNPSGRRVSIVGVHHLHAIISALHKRRVVIACLEHW